MLADEASGRLFIADSNHNRIVVAGLDGKLQATIGSGAIGAADGPFASATFDHPQGMALHGDTLYIADTENHLLRKADLKQQTVVTIAGTGKQGPARVRAGKPKLTPLTVPGPCGFIKKNLYIAMAGPHQIWRMPLTESDIGPYAGNGREDIVDGRLLPHELYAPGYCSFAQPSGLSSDGTSLFVADSEGSSIRAVPFDPRKEVRTILGTAGQPQARLFTFGDVDGGLDTALLQHPLDVQYHDGKVYVADTYNSKIKAFDLSGDTLQTIAGSGKPGSADSPAQFRQPAGLSYAGNKLYVADTNNHAIRTIDLANADQVSTLTIDGLEPPKLPQRDSEKPSFPGAVKLKVDPVTVAPADGTVRLHISLTLPRGYKINAEGPMRYLVESEGAGGPIDGTRWAN